MSTQKQLHTFILIIVFLLSCHIANAQGSENAIAIGAITALLAGGLILFLIIMPIVARLSRKKNDSSEDNKTDSSPVSSDELESEPRLENDSENGSILIKGCVTLIICLILGAMIVSMMFK